jgi:hypothetical protein
MDIAFIIVSIILTGCSIVFVVNMLDDLCNKPGVFFCILPLFCIGIFIWTIVAVSTAQPRISYHPVKTISEGDKEIQVILLHDDIININRATGQMFKEGDVIKVEDSVGVWSKGIYCVSGRIKLFKTNQETTEGKPNE